MKQLIVAVLFCVVGAGPALACKVTHDRAANRQIEAGKRINQEVLSKAILAETNYHRCRQGLPKLGHNRGMMRVSADHSAWMSRAAKITHDSTTRGRRDLRQRLDASGIKYRLGAENLAYVSLYDFRGERYRISGACQFSRANGEPIRPKTYRGLARELVHYWVTSPGHRKNMMKPGVRAMSAGIDVKPGGPYCGTIYATQMFAG